MSALRCALAIAVLSPISGCFADGGAALTQTSAATEPALSTSSGTTTATATTGEPATTEEPGSTATDPTPGTGTGAPTTGDGATEAPLCPGVMECAPGDVMQRDELCDPCGRVRRTCQPDCTWGADECVEDLSSCAYWYLDDLQEGWTRVALPVPPPEHAPTAPVIAAFDLAQHGRIFALTAATYHVMNGADRTWIASGPREALLPDLGGELLQTYAVYNAVEDRYVVYAVGDPAAWLYTLPPAGTQAAFATSDACCNSWTDTVSPPSQQAVRDMYVDLAAPHPWTGGDYLCGNDLLPLNDYAAWVTPTDVYLQEISACFDMVAGVPLGQFAPFAAPGAPPGDRVGGVALLGERLYVFAGV